MNDAASTGSRRWLKTLLLLTGIEGLAAAAITLLIPADPKNAVLLGFSLARLGLMAGLVGISAAALLLAFSLDRYPALSINVDRILKKPWAQALPPVLLALVTAGLFAAQASLSMLTRLAPGLLFAWLAGLQWVYFTLRYHPRKVAEIAFPAGARRHDHWFAAASIMMAYIALFLPVGIPGWTNGAPWNTLPEFALTALVIPFGALVGWRFYANRKVFWLLAAVLVIRGALLLTAPSPGLNVRIYGGEAQMDAQQWTPTYATILFPGYSDVMLQPYSSMREFPLEWVNVPRFNYDRLWVGVEVYGYAALNAGDRLVFTAQGMDRAAVQYRDVNTGQMFPVEVWDGAQPVDAGIYERLPGLQQLEMQGWFTLLPGQHSELDALIIEPSGQARPAFAAGIFWRSQYDLQRAAAARPIHSLLANLTGALALLIAIAAVLSGARNDYLQRHLNPLDLYLFASGAAGMLVYQFQLRNFLDAYVPIILALFAALRLVGYGLARDDQPAYAGRQWLYAAGAAVLILFLALDMHRLQEIVVFPQGQDSLAYQYFARQIFVQGDILLHTASPHAYKILFPYLVGLLHLLFGQSPAGEFFLNAWCAVVIGLIVVRLLAAQKTPAWLSYSAGALLVWILSLPSFFTFFFRFGLIEPAATACLLALLWSMQRKQAVTVAAFGLLTVLFRLDYLGAALAAVTLSAGPVVGAMRAAWGQLWAFIRQNWKWITAYTALLTGIPAVIILYYTLSRDDYVLHARDTVQTSAGSILEGIKRIVIGGSIEELALRLQYDPLDAVVITTVLVLGVVLALAALVYRGKRMSQVDMRWGMIILGLLSIYLFVKPTGYSPRFSTPLLPLAILAAVHTLHRLLNRKNNAASR